jgi:hypothetical protein
LAIAENGDLDKNNPKFKQFLKINLLSKKIHLAAPGMTVQHKKLRRHR